MMQSSKYLDYSDYYQCRNTYPKQGFEQSVRHFQPNSQSYYGGIPSPAESSVNSVTSEQDKRTAIKRKPDDSSNDDSPALRALLTNPAKKLKYSTDYYPTRSNQQSSPQPPNSNFPNYSDFNSRGNHGASTEYSHFDKSSFLPSHSDPNYHASTMKMQSHSNDGGLQVPINAIADNFPTTNKDSLSNMTTSPATAFVEGINTPPLSPPESRASPQVIDHLKTCQSSPSIPYQWTQNGSTSGKIMLLFPHKGNFV